MKRFVVLMVLGFAACSDEPSGLDAAVGLDAAFPDVVVAADVTASDAVAVDAVASDAVASDAAASDAVSEDAAEADAGVIVWPRPACAMIQGTGGVTYTLNEGRDLTPTSGVLSGTAYTYGLVALDAPGVMLAVHDRELIRSTDSGCTWTSVGPLTGGFPPSLVAAGLDRAYAWSDNNRELYRIDGTTITPLVSPDDNLKGIAVDPANPDRLRVAGRDGQIYESLTAGVGRFVPVGSPPFGQNGFVYRVAFDPSNISRAVAGSGGQGARWTNDDGTTWTPVMGLSSSTTARDRANIFELAYSPASADVVWFEGIDLEENSAGAPGEGRHIWYSSDGAATARPVLTRTATITLINGNLLVPHPSSPNILYFVFGTYFQGYGTDIFRYDVRTSSLTVHNNRYQDVNAIEFAPGDPEVMYLGLTNER